MRHLLTGGISLLGSVDVDNGLVLATKPTTTSTRRIGIHVAHRVVRLIVNITTPRPTVRPNVRLFAMHRTTTPQLQMRVLAAVHLVVVLVDRLADQPLIRCLIGMAVDVATILELRVASFA
jgi:hypothetical protein